MAKSKTEMEVNIGANIKDLVKAIEEAKKLISSLSDSFKQGLKLAVDVKNIKSEIRDVKNEIKSELIAKPFKVNVEVDSNKLKSNIKTALREAIKEINTQGINSKLKLPTAPKMKVTVDTSSARTSIRNLKNMLQKNEVRINTGKAEGDIIRLSTYMNQLASKKVTPQIDTSKAEQAKLSIAELATYMNQLQSKKIKIDISFENKDIVNNLKDIDSLLKSIQKNSNIKLNVNATGRAGGGGVQSQLQQYRTLRQEARHFALEAEKAWTAGNRQGFEQNRQNFLVAMKDLADFSRQLGNLSASREAGMYSNMLRSLQQTSPLYNDILNKIKQLKQEQKDFNNLINEGNNKLKLGGGGLRQSGSQQRLPGFMQGTVGASAYAIHYLGRSSKGFGSFGEATAELISDLNSLGGTVSKVMIPIAALAGTVAVTVTAFTTAIKGIEVFGGLLKQIGQEVYNALKPGIDLYKQQTSAFFSFTASFMSNGILSDKVNGDKKLSSMVGGRDIASSLSLKLLRQAQIDAETSAFSLQDILASLQGTLPILMSHGMTADQAYEINKGVAAVAKMIQLTPSQILQETRDLAQGSITSRGSQVANALGITNADLKKFEGDAEGLYSFLIGKFEQYKDLLTEFEDTALGRWQQFQERWQTVARNIVEGTLPQFKGLFEGLIEYTGEWQSKYIDQAGNENLAKLNAMTGKWQDAVTGMELPDFKPSDAFFKLSEPFEKLQKILPEIVKHLAETIDEIIQFIEEETGISDPIELAKQAIDFLIDGFKLSVKVLVELISTLESIENILKIFEPILVPIINLIRSMGNGFLFVVSCVDALISGVRLAVATVRELWNAVWNENDAWSKAQQKEALNSYIASGSKVGKSFEDWMNMEYYDSYDSMFKSLGQRKNKKFTTFEDFISKYASGELNVKNTDKNLGNLRGEPKNTEDDKARKKRIQESQKALKARLAELKEILSDQLDRLKDLLEKNEVSYKEGFKSITDYLKEKTELEKQEAQARLEEAQAEMRAIQESEFNSPYEKERETHKVQREIDKYTKQLSKATVTQSELHRDTINFVNAFEHATDRLEMILTGKYNQNVNNSQQLTTSSNGEWRDLGDSLVSIASYVSSLTGYDPKLLWAQMMHETGGDYKNQRLYDDHNYGGISAFDGATNKNGRARHARPASEGGWYEWYENDKEYADAWIKVLAQAKNLRDAKDPTSFAKALKEMGYYTASIEEYTSGLSNWYKQAPEFSKGVQSVIGANVGQQVGTMVVSSITDALEYALSSEGGDLLYKQMPDLKDGCVEAVVQLGSYYNDLLLNEAKKGTVNVDVLRENLEASGVKYEDYVKGSTVLQPGDVLVNNDGNHVMLVLDKDHVVGNSSGLQNPRYGGESGIIKAPLEGWHTNTAIGVLRTGTAGVNLGGSNVLLESAHLSKEAMDNFNLYQDFLNKYNDVLSSINDDVFGNLPMLDVKLRSLYEQLQKASRSSNPQDVKMADALRTRIAQETNKAVTDALTNQLDFNISRLETTASYRSVDLAYGKNEYLDTDIFDIVGKYYDYFYSAIDTKEIKDRITKIKSELEKYADIDDTNTEVERLNKELADLEAQLDLVKQRPANQIELLKKQFVDATNSGNTKLAETIKKKIFESEDALLGMYEKWIDGVNKKFDSMGDYFDALPMTDLQRERGEEELKAYRNQQLSRFYRATLGSQQKALGGIQQRKSEVEYGISNRIGDVKELRAEYALLIEDEERWRQKIIDTTQKIRISDELGKLPDLLEKTRRTAKQALEDGLVTFLTDGINEAENLSEALKNLAIDFLKTMQQFFAKQAITSLMNKWFPVKTGEGEHTSTLNLSPPDFYLPIVEAINQQTLALTGNNVYGNPMNDQVNTTVSSYIPKYAQSFDYTGAFSKPWEYSELNPNRKYTFDTTSFNNPWGTLSTTPNNNDNNNANNNQYTFSAGDYGLGSLSNVAQTASTSINLLGDNSTQAGNALMDSLGNVNTQQAEQERTATLAQLSSSESSTADIITTTVIPALTELATQFSMLASTMAGGAGAGAGGMATGGLIKGQGTSTSDDIPAMLSNGEFVVKADAVKKYGINYLNALNEGKLGKIKSKLPKFAEGGLISSVAQDNTARGVSNFGKDIGKNINNTNNISVALVRDETEAVRELLKSTEGQRIMLDFSRKYAKFTSRL